MFLDQRDHKLFEKERHAFGGFDCTCKQGLRQFPSAWHRRGDLKCLGIRKLFEFDYLVRLR